jgi:hypothetical protein
MRTLLLLAMLATLSLVAACDTTGPADNSALYTISGKLRFDSAMVIPTDTRVRVLFDVTSGTPDYAYIFGSGTVNLSDSTFKLVFTEPPPAEALNRYGLGVGAIVLLPGAIADGKVAGDTLDSLVHQMVGLAEDYAVIYLGKSPDSVALERQWAGNFKNGFNMGKGIRKTQEDDEFEPTEPNIIEILINLIENLDWVDWT